MNRTVVWSTCIAVLAVTLTSNAALVTFEDLVLPPQSHWNGADGSGDFRSGGAVFPNTYNADWDMWVGFGYSNIADPETRGLAGQYSAIAGSGQGGSSTYGVAFVGWEQPPTVTLTTPQTLSGLYVTNNNYAYYDMAEGGAFSKRFGGATGNDPDWFRLSITGADAEGNVTGTVEFYLADFRFADNDKDFIVDSWQFVDLTSLGEVRTLQLALDSSDTGTFGMNTPGYFCIDTIVPEPATALLLGLGALVAVRWRR